MSDSVTPWVAACQASPSFPISQSVPDSCPLNQWGYLTNPSSATLFSSCLQSFPPAGSFSVSRLFTSCGKVWKISASISFFPVNIQDWFPLGLTCLISLLSKGLLRVFYRITIWKHQFFGVQPSLWFSSHIHSWYWKNHTYLKNHSFDYTDLCQQSDVPVIKYGQHSFICILNL